MHVHLFGDGAEFPAPTDELASARFCVSLSFGLRSNLVPAFFAALRPSFARLWMRSRSSSASAERNARKPCRILVARSRWVSSKDPDGGSASIHALHNGNAVELGTGRSVPFGEHEHVTLAEGINIWG